MGCGRAAEWSEKIPARSRQRFWPFTSSSTFPCDIIYNDKSELFHNPHQHSIRDLCIMPPEAFFYSLNERKIWEFGFDFSILDLNEVAECKARSLWWICMWCCYLFWVYGCWGQEMGELQTSGLMPQHFMREIWELIFEVFNCLLFSS